MSWRSEDGGSNRKCGMASGDVNVTICVSEIRIA